MINFFMNNVNMLAYDCTLLGAELTAILKDVFMWVEISIPVVAIVLCTVDLTQAVIAQDEGAIKKAQNKCIKRIIVGIAIFFVPVLLDILLTYGGNIIGTCGIGG